ncbi:EmrB/QacA subfamily drug resistance transporter [Saccharopolyspora erythraea NRRL 2338]|uniref:Major facilitator superfamily (MFS) profile domain-containing protein n=1 Tax=Saccharopolyspora erythraea TaxID=1836 RepID=A0ABN1DMK4_SACER|nr:MFS transporter [Saccharopolyspora erythraea]EQD83281.1 major facilitator transporter [Saccharopolyspora erythraea D]PFG93082.1 EmrB/QacA subfamily drug resistance transporter [Saccharopolyspora erythraea NRRL 2338]QRK89955.1 MFS transporter [Saccharopolyspora erythraea]
MLRPGSFGLVLPGLLLAMLLAALDQTVMTPALPSVAGDLGGLDQMPAVITAYLVAATVVMPVHGKLGDRFGRKPAMLAAVAVFVTGAALCGLATSMPQLIVFRVIQGAGGGGLIIGAQAVIGELVSPRERGRYLGLFGAAYAVAVVGGPLVGGFFVDQLSWRWIFAIHPPLGLLAFAVLAWSLRLPAPAARPPVDCAGALALATAVVGVVLFGQTGSPGWLVCALAGTAVWLVTTRYAADPILPLRLFGEPAFAIPVGISVLIGFALFGTLTYMPAFLRIASGATATQAGLVVTTLMLGVLTSSVVSGRLITRTGHYKVFPVVGTAVAACGLALLALLAPTAGPAAIGAVMLLTGLGVGLVMQVMVLATQNAVEHRDLGTATSSVTFFRQIGASAGVAVTGALVTAGGAHDPAAFGGSLRTAFAVMAPLLGVAFLLALALPARPLRTTAHVRRTP